MALSPAARQTFQLIAHLQRPEIDTFATSRLESHLVQLLFLALYLYGLGRPSFLINPFRKVLYLGDD